MALYFYGEDAPPRMDLPAIPPGGIFTGYLSKLAPDFQGYIIAIANFQFCDGSAFIADAEFTKGKKQVAREFALLWGKALSKSPILCQHLTENKKKTATKW